MPETMTWDEAVAEEQPRRRGFRRRQSDEPQVSVGDTISFDEATKATSRPASRMKLGGDPFRARGVEDAVTEVPKRFPVKNLLAEAAKSYSTSETAADSFLYDTERMPLVGSAVNAVDTIQSVVAAKRLEAANGNEDRLTDEEWNRLQQDIDQVGRHLGRGMRDQNKGLADSVFDTVSRIPGFAAEIGMTGGAYTGPKALASLALRDVSALSGPAARAALSRAGGVAVQTAANPARVVNAVAQRMIPSYQMTADDQGQLTQITQSQPGENIIEALPRGFADAAIELASERAGGPIAKAIGNIPGAARIGGIKRAIAERWLGSGTSRTVKELAENLAKQGGWNGVVGEVLEERVGELARNLIGNELPGDTVTGQSVNSVDQWLKGNPEEAAELRDRAIKQLTIEGISFAVPGAVSITAEAGANLLDRTGRASPAPGVQSPVSPAPAQESVPQPATDAAIPPPPVEQPTATQQPPTQPTVTQQATTQTSPAPPTVDYSKEKIAEWAGQNPDQAGKLLAKAQAGEPISRRDFHEAGLWDYDAQPEGPGRRIRQRFAKQLTKLMGGKVAVAEVTESVTQPTPESSVTPAVEETPSPPVVEPTPAEEPVVEQPVSTTPVVDPQTEVQPPPVEQVEAPPTPQPIPTPPPVAKKGFKKKVKPGTPIANTDDMQSAIDSALDEAMAVEASPAGQEDKSGPLGEAGIKLKKTLKGWSVTGIPEDFANGLQADYQGNKAGTGYFFRKDPTEGLLNAAKEIAEEAKRSATATASGLVRTRIGTLTPEAAEYYEQERAERLKSARQQIEERNDRVERLLSQFVHKGRRGQFKLALLRAAEKSDASSVKGFDKIVQFTRDQPELGFPQDESELIEMLTSESFVKDDASLLDGIDDELAAEIERELGEQGEASFDFGANVDKGGEGGFQLARESTAGKPKPEDIENATGTQRRMFSGMDALPGQQDLFDDLDKPAEPVAESTKPATLTEKASARKQRTGQKLEEAAEELQRSFQQPIGITPDPKRDAESLDRQVKAAAKFARAAIDHGVSTFAEYVALVAETLGYDGTIAAADVLERTWNTLRKRTGFERLDEAGQTAGVLKKPVQPVVESGTDDTTGTKNAKTDELRAKAGMEERPPVEPESVDQWEAAAAKRIADDPNYAVKLAEELAAKPRAIDATEEAALGRHLRDLENRRQAGEDVGDEIATAVEASERVGTEWGRAGVSRQVELAADFSLAGIVRQHLRSVNEKPTDEQMAKYGEMADRIKQLEGERDELQQKLMQAEIAKQIAEAKATSTAATEQQANAAEKPRRTIKRQPGKIEAEKVSRDYADLRNLIDAGSILSVDYESVGTGVAIEDGGTLSELLDMVTLNEQQHALWRVLRPILESQTRGMPSIRVSPDLIKWKDRAGVGAYEPLQHHITIAKKAMESEAAGRVLLHEAVHAATRNAALIETSRYFHGNRDANVSDRSRQAYSRISAIANWIEQEVHKSGLSTRDIGLPGDVNAVEIIAEAFTRPKFQEFLASRKVPRSTKFADLRGKTLFEAFVDFVKRILGIGKGSKAASALEEVIGLSETIMQEDVGPRGATVAMESDGPSLLSVDSSAARDTVARLVRAEMKRGAFALGQVIQEMTTNLGAERVERVRQIIEEEWNKARDVAGPKPDADEIGQLARELTRWAVESGIEGRENVINAVHEELTKAGIEITRSQTMEAMSGYGDFRELSKDEVSIKVREINGEIQQLLKLEDMQAGQAPKKTGVERREPTDEERRLIKLVNEAKKRGGYVVTDPGSQLKSALGSAKTAIRNRIADLEREIETREKIVKERTPLQPDAELTALRDRRDKLNEEHKKVFPPKKNGMSDARRLKMAEQALERQIADLQADLAAGRLGPKEQKAPQTSPEIDAKRKQLAQLQEIREQARAASPEYQAQQAAKQTARYKQALERQKAFWEQRRDDARQGQLPTKRKPTPVDDAILEKKYQIELAKREARAEIENAERAARGKLGKALGFGGDLLDLARSIQTGFEMSAVLRQGAVYSLGYPRQALPALMNSVRAALSRRADFAIHDDLMKRPNHADYVRGGLETTADDGPLSAREELLRSRLASWLVQKEGARWAPLRWAAEGIKGGERAFRSFLNTMRADMFDSMKAGVDASRPGTWSEQDAKTIANAANVFSGRAPLKNSVEWSRVFFAPRWMWSRVQLMTLQPLRKANDAATRRAVAKVYVRAVMGMAAAQVIRFVLYSLTADDDEHKPTLELDARSSGFGKMRLGETRIDSGTGVNQLITLAARLITGETKRASGEIVPIRGDDVPYGADDSWDIAGQFLRTKLAPLPSAVTDFIVGKNVVGQEVTAGKLATDRVTPMTWRDIWEAEKELNVPQGTVAAVDAFFGTGISTYGQRTNYRDADEAGRKEQFEKDLERMEWDSPAPAYQNSLTPEQRKQVDARREEKRRSVVYEATAAEPERKNYKSDQSYEKELKLRTSHLERFKEMAPEVTYDKARELLRGYYLDQHGKITPSYGERLKSLRKLYDSQNLQ